MLNTVKSVRIQLYTLPCIMTLDEFRSTLSQTAPPKTSPLLQAMWYDAQGDWEKAHNLAQDVSTSKGSWVHAYLHRKEGDAGNASYWYRLANKKMPSTSLDDEWNEIVADLLKD